MVFITSTNGTCESDRAKKVWPQIRDRAHQQATSGAAFDGDARWVAVTSCGQVFDCSDEIGEGIPLHEHLAGIVPRLAEIAAAANMRIGNDHAAIEQAEPI